MSPEPLPLRLPIRRADRARHTSTLTAALGDSAWQIREGAARGLSGVGSALAIDPLRTALEDVHPDIRKAAVLTLSTWSESESARLALEFALADTDADVRAYARRALAVHSGT